MRKLGIVAALVVVGLVCGCSTPKGKFKLSPRRVTIRTEPEGAKVTQLRPLDMTSLDLGATPLVNRSVNVLTHISMNNMPFNQAQEFMDHANNVVVLIEKDGYEPYRGNFATRPNEVMEYSINLVAKSEDE